MATYYMHTINGKPGTFDGIQICYAVFYGNPNALCSSLEQIRREQKLTAQYRNENGFTNDSRYGHLRFAAPASTEVE